MRWRIIIKAVVGVALLYGGACGLLFFEQRQLIYQPAATRPVRQTPDFTLKREGGVVLRGWIMNPGQPRALLYFGGNGERIESERQLFARWFPHRTAYLLAYRGYAASDGVPSEAALIGDALALYDGVAAHHSGIAVAGRSLGSGVATQLAAQRPVERLALITPFDSLQAVAAAQFPYVPVRWLLTDRYESWRYADRIHCPVLLLHAEQDRLVQPARTLWLATYFHPAPAMLAIAGAGHNSIDGYPEYAQALGEFLQ